MFQPALRYQPEKIRQQASDILQSPYFPQLLEDVPVVLLIINDARQVVFVNKDLLAEASGKTRQALLGIRPGECLECWGTYSIKLLTEKYLKGKAGFSSEKNAGTIFSIIIPEGINGQ